MSFSSPPPTFPYNPLRWPACLLLLVTLLLHAACERTQPVSTQVATLYPENSSSLYIEACNLLPTNRPLAKEKFLQVIDERNGNAPFSHRQVALICLKEENALSAIYHLERYIQLGRNSKDRAISKEELDDAASKIADAERIFLKKVAGRLLDPSQLQQPNRVDLDEKIRSLRFENDQLKITNAALDRRIAELERTLKVQSGANQPTNPNLPKGDTVPAWALTPATPPPPPKPPKTYTVVKGDTLSEISRKVYGVGTRYNEIYNANRDKIPNDKRLKIGVVLTIPGNEQSAANTRQ